MKGRWLAVLCGTLALSGCNGNDGAQVEGSTKLEVECIGMSMREPLGGYYLVQTDVGERCRLLISDTVYDPSNVEIIRQDLGNFGNPNTAVLLVRFGGKNWVGRSGTLQLDRHEGTRAAGRYRILATEETTGEEAELSGPIDWCDYGANPDCPYQTNGLESLPKRVQFRDPDGYSADPATSRASECRVLISESRAAVRVDIQLGVLNGTNLARFRDRCGPGVSMTAGFRFMATNVDGPGTYGPVVSTPLPSATAEPKFLPDFHLDVPTIYWMLNCLNSPQNRLDTRPTDGTSCTFTIAENPGKFEIRCTDALHSETVSAYFKKGDFTLSSDCDVRYVP
jgi:hypothetical protein